MNCYAKKFFCILLALTMVLTMAACGGGDAAAATNSAPEQENVSEPEQADMTEPEQADAAEPEQPQENDHIIPLDYVLFDNEDFYVAVTGFDTSYEFNGKMVQGLMVDFVNHTTETDVYSPDFKRASLDITDVVVNGCRTYENWGSSGRAVDPGASNQEFRNFSPSKINGIRYIDTLSFRGTITNIHDEPLYQDTFTLEIHAGEGEATYTPEFDGAPFILAETDECLVELSGYVDEPDTGIRRYIVHTVNNTDQTIHADVYQYDVNGIQDFYVGGFYGEVLPHTDLYSTFYFTPENLAASGVSTVDSIRLNSLSCYYRIIQEDGSRKVEDIAKTDITIPYPGEAVGPLIDPDGPAGE